MLAKLFASERNDPFWGNYIHQFRDVVKDLTSVNRIARQRTSSPHDADSTADLASAGKPTHAKTDRPSAQAGRPTLCQAHSQAC